MRRILAVAISLTLLASCAERPDRTRAGSAEGRPPDGFRRIAEILRRDRTFRCTAPSSCAFGTLASWPVPDPRGPGSFQLVVTLTLTYRLSEGDEALIGINAMCPLTSPPSPCPYPVPRANQPIASVGTTTTTLTWALSPSDGPGSLVYFTLTLRDRGGDGSVELESKRVTAAFEMWPAPG